MIERSLALRAEPPVRRVKDHSGFHALAPSLVEGRGTGATIFGEGLGGVLAGTWLINFQ